MAEIGEVLPGRPYELVFATTNRGKLAMLQSVAEPLVSKGLLSISQADDVEDVARAKAAYAFRELRRPVLVQDSGLIVEALGDFPGPYTKYVLATIGVPGLLRLMEGRTGEQRKAGFANCLCFCAAEGQVRCFREPLKYYGVIAERAADGERNTLLSNWTETSEGPRPLGLEHIFAPTDAPRSVPLCQLEPDELRQWRAGRPSAARVFISWLADQLGTGAPG
eukprot:TRINITY_DN34637_c0_g1_i2.p1 TRINITY_DN34637_c0_g1~~TRINITY_DN34637_c0_g1_i2.p1  ORF type:complete len:247 (+),score=65.34 TRINITY_DN34637_c0_g1_i2:77-742(+)